MSAGLAAPGHGAGEAPPVPDEYAARMRVEVRPPWPFRLAARGGMDGLTRASGSGLRRLLHRGGAPVLVRVAQPARERVLFEARAADAELCGWGIERMRRATGVDHDLAAFHERFRFDPLIGRALAANPWRRVAGRPDPFEALMWAICEQLIEYERAVVIERRLIARLGSRCPHTGLRDSPPAAVLAVQAPARLESLDLSAGRSLALVRAAREVAAGRAALDPDDPEPGWRRLRAIPGIGAWTVQSLALHGQGRLDQLPAGDLAYVKLVGRLTHDDPRARATEAEVREFFAPYAPWAGLAGVHALHGSGRLRRTAA